MIYADDLNCFMDFGLYVVNVDIAKEVKRCQQELHKWGYANQLNVKASKQLMHILAIARKRNKSNFKLLGVHFDHALSIKDAVVKLTSEATWNIHRYCKLDAPSRTENL